MVMDLDQVEFSEESAYFPQFGGNTGLPPLNMSQTVQIISSHDQKHILDLKKSHKGLLEKSC